MKHRVTGRKLGRSSAHRLAVLRNLSRELFDKERVTTTLMKAKELRPFAEKLLTTSKRETLHARRLVLRHIPDRDIVAKMFDTLSQRYSQRPGGYTRIVKLGPRRGDNAEMALIELVDAELKAKAGTTKDKGGKKAEAADKKAKGKTEAAEAGTEETAAKKPARKRAAAPKAEKAKAPKEKAAKAAKPAKVESKGKSKAAGATTRKVGKSGS